MSTSPLFQIFGNQKGSGKKEKKSQIEYLMKTISRRGTEITIKDGKNGKHNTVWLYALAQWDIL